jgi:D-alanine-D-alanine ligase-like ATP-grasp enzyme
MRDVTEIIHHDYKNLAINATKDMGLRMCWVDVMTRYPIQSAIKNEKNVAIIEMNGLPWFGHYATLWKKQYQIVKAMYKKILLAIEKQLSSSHE